MTEPIDKDLNPTPATNRMPIKAKKFFTRELKEFVRPSREHFRVESFPPSIKVIFRKEAFLKIQALIAECSIEISWMSTCVQDDNGCFIIKDVYVPEQVCTGVTTEMTEDGVSNLLFEFQKAGIIEEINNLKCWGHSHVNMGVSPSGVDENQTDEFISRFDTFFIRIIGNKRAELSCHVYILGKDGIIRHIIHHPDLVVEGGPFAENEYTDWAINEIDNKVETRRSLWNWGIPKTKIVSDEPEVVEPEVVEAEVVEATVETPAEEKEKDDKA